MMRNRWLGLLVFGGVFYIFYPLSNLYAKQLFMVAGLPTVATAWDKWIPFVPAMIVPYACSIPLLIISFFVIPIHEVTRHSLRLLLITLVAVLCFYLYPLHFSFQITSYQGLGVDWRWAYQWLHQLDKPFNQLPSLHVAYAVLIALTLHHTAQLTKARYFGLMGVCFLVALSTLFTWQHHLWDMVAGVALAIGTWIVEQSVYRRYGAIVSQNILKYVLLALIWGLIWLLVPVVVMGYPLALTVKVLTTAIAALGALSLLIMAYLYHRQAAFDGMGYIRHFFDKQEGRLTWRPMVLVWLPILSYRLFAALTHRRSLYNTQKTAITLNHGALSFLSVGYGQNDSIQHILNAYPTHTLIYIDTLAELNHTAPLWLTTAHRYFYQPRLDLSAYDQHTLSELIALGYQIEHQLRTSDNVLVICQCFLGLSRSVALMACLIAYFGRLSAADIRKLLDTHHPTHRAHCYLDDAVLTALAHNSLGE